nr:mechanosensitive ion channel family protein [uncultured Carboxylicivirga sp.]
MRTLVLYCIVSFFLLISFCISAQVDSINKSDTVKTGSAEKVVQLLMRSDSIALADSINTLILKKQLEELRSFERSKRIKIEQELEEIKRKDSIQQLNMITDVNRLKKDAVGFPVLIHKDTLFMVYTKIGSLTADERAEVINERLEKLYKAFVIKTDSLNVATNGQNAELYYNDKIILSVTEYDELWFEKSKNELIHNYKQLIVNDIVKYKKDKSLLKKLREFGLALLVIVIQILLIKLINVFFRAKINVLLWNKRGVWFKGIKFRNQEIVNQNRETSAIIFVVKLFRYAIIAILLYISIPILFSIFPSTQRLAEVLFGYILSPLKTISRSILSYTPEFITILVIILITRYLLKFIKFIFHEIETEKITIPGFFADWAKPSYNIIKVLILAFMFVVIFPYLPGSESPVFKGVSVFLGIVFSLGSTSVIGNMVAGLVITYMRPFKLGDRIKIGEVIGNVVEKTAFVTRIQSPKNEFITIPNSNILSSNVTNYSNSKLQGGVVVHTTVTIGYDVPWRQVHQILINAAKKTSNLNSDIAPFVLQTSLDDFYVSYQLNAHTNEPDKQPGIYSELHQNIQDGFNEAGIEILSPHYRAARDGNQMAVPKEYLPEDYKTPGFIVKHEKDS